jgi:hypothetical protein
MGRSLAGHALGLSVIAASACGAPSADSFLRPPGSGVTHAVVTVNAYPD